MAKHVDLGFSPVVKKEVDGPSDWFDGPLPVDPLSEESIASYAAAYMNANMDTGRELYDRLRVPPPIPVPRENGGLSDAAEQILARYRADRESRIASGTASTRAMYEPSIASLTNADTLTLGTSYQWVTPTRPRSLWNQEYNAEDPFEAEPE